MPDATAIPSGGGQQSTAAGAVDIVSQLITAANAADQKAAAATRAASIPISGGHQQPQSVVQPGAGHTYTQMPLDHSQVYGKRQAQEQGIANIGKSVANIVNQVQQQRDQKKTQELSVNIEHLMGAVNSEDQAKQILAQDPNNQAAKDQLAKAQAIQGEVLNDDKNRKSIAKAFNINFVDPSKNNTPEHAALKQATDSYAKQFQDKLPTQMAPNPQAVAAAQSATAEAKATHDLVDKLAPAIVAAGSRENVEAVRAQTAKDVAKLESDERYSAAQYTANLRYQGVIQGANIHVQGMITAAKMRDDTLIQTTQSRIDALNGVDGHSPKVVQSAQKSFDSITKTMGTYEDHISKLEQLRDKADPARKDMYNKQIQFFESQMSVMQLKQQELAARLSQAGETPTATPNSPGATTTSPNYVADTDDDPSDDPNQYDQ